MAAPCQCYTLWFECTDECCQALQCELEIRAPPEFWMPPSAMTGTPACDAARATWYTAVAWPRPTAHTCRRAARAVSQWGDSTARQLEASAVHECAMHPQQT